MTVEIPVSYLGEITRCFESTALNHYLRPIPVIGVKFF